MQARVKLRHPKTGGVWMCPADAVDGWLAKGWERADAVSVTAVPSATTRKDK